MRQRLYDLYACAASPLVGLKYSRPVNRVGIGAQRSDVVEGDRLRSVDAERAQQRRLSALAQLEREHVGAVQYARAEALERSHVREGQGHCTSVPADVRARARLVEVHIRCRNIDVAECRPLQIERLERDTPALERGKEWLLPLRMLKEHDKIEVPSHVAHGKPCWPRREKRIGEVLMVDQSSLRDYTGVNAGGIILGPPCELGGAWREPEERAVVQMVVQANAQRRYSSWTVPECWQVFTKSGSCARTNRRLARILRTVAHWISVSVNNPFRFIGTRSRRQAMHTRTLGFLAVATAAAAAFAGMGQPVAARETCRRIFDPRWPGLQECVV